MIRSTTPKQAFEIANVDVSTLKELQVTYSQDNIPLVVKLKDDVTIEDNVISFTLTQDETLAFEDKPVEIQMKVLTEDDEVLASRIFRVPVLKVLNEEKLGEEVSL